MSKYALLLITLFVMGSFSQRGGKLGDGKGPDPVFKPDDPEECEFECTSQAQVCIEKDDDCYYESAEEYTCYDVVDCPKGWFCSKEKEDDDKELGYCERHPSWFFWLCVFCIYCLIIPSIILGFILFKVKEDDKRRKLAFIQLNPEKLGKTTQ